jgi:hypothetical protein
MFGYRRFRRRPPTKFCSSNRSHAREVLIAPRHFKTWDQEKVRRITDTFVHTRALSKRDVEDDRELMLFYAPRARRLSVTDLLGSAASNALRNTDSISRCRIRSARPLRSDEGTGAPCIVCAGDRIAFSNCAPSPHVGGFDRQSRSPDCRQAGGVAGISSLTSASIVCHPTAIAPGSSTRRWVRDFRTIRSRWKPKRFFRPHSAVVSSVPATWLILLSLFIVPRANHTSSYGWI